MATYEVLKEHGTPRTYKRGETRDLEPADAAGLLEAGALKLKEAAGSGGKHRKADLVEEAKAERAAPLNKAEPVPDFNKTKPRVPRE